MMDGRPKVWFYAHRPLPIAFDTTGISFGIACHAHLVVDILICFRKKKPLDHPIGYHIAELDGQAPLPAFEAR